MKYVIEEIQDRKARSLHFYDNLLSFWGIIHDSVNGSGKQSILKLMECEVKVESKEPDAIA